jgi:hypothetical protein
MPLELPGDPYVCQPCRLKLWPASEAEAHLAWHQAQAKRRSSDWMFGGMAARVERLKEKRHHKPTGHRLKKEGISKRRSNPALGEI